MLEGEPLESVAYSLPPLETGTMCQMNQNFRVVPLAMDRAIREIITPVVERSVTIACMTTRELVLKDFALEGDENYTQNSAGLMVASLAGSLAHVTCKLFSPVMLVLQFVMHGLLQNSPVLQRSLQILFLLVLANDGVPQVRNFGRHFVQALTQLQLLHSRCGHFIVVSLEPLRVAMANHLRNLLQLVNLSGDVLEQAVNLVTNDNLDLGCAVIEKSATEKEQRDLSDAIGPALAARRSKRDGNNAAYYDAAFYSGPIMSQLPEVLRPKPGRLSSAQQRVYEDFACLPWQNQSSQSASTLTGPPASGSSISVSTPYASGQGNGPAFNGGHSRAVLRNGRTHQVTELGVDELDLRGHTSLSCPSSALANMQPQETNLLLPHFSGNSTSSLDINGGDDSSAFQGSTHPGDFSSQPPLPTEQLGPTVVESSLTTGEVMEKYHLVAQKLHAALPKLTTVIYATLPPDHEVWVPPSST